MEPGQCSTGQACFAHVNRPPALHLQVTQGSSVVVTDLSAVTSCPFTLHPTKEAISRVVQHTEQSPIVQLADVLTCAHRAALAGRSRNRIGARRIAVQSRLRDHSGFASEDSTWVVLLGPLRLGFMMDSIPRTTFGRSNRLNFRKGKKRRRTVRLISQWQNQGSCRAHLTETREEQERKKKKRKRTIRNPLASIELRVGPWSNATRRLPV